MHVFSVRDLGERIFGDEHNKKYLKAIFNSNKYYNHASAPVFCA
jgi:hypothetical protein